MKRVVDWLFRSRVTGRITIAQWPNPPLWIFAAATLCEMLLPSPGRAELVMRSAANLALAWWAADEVLRGVNPWRRILGAGVLTLQAAALL